MTNARITGTAATYAEDLATIEARNAYRDSMTMESTGEARPYMAIGRDEPLEALTALWDALYGDVAEDAEDVAEDAIASEDVIAYIRRVGGSDVAYSAPIGGTATESRTWYDALATDWEHVARIGILERYETEPNLTVLVMSQKERGQGWTQQRSRYGYAMPTMWIGNPSKDIPMAIAPGRNGRGHERTSVRGVTEGAPIRNAGTLAASIANGGLAVDAKTRKAAEKAAETPEQSAARRARKAAALKAKRHAAK